MLKPRKLMKLVSVMIYSEDSMKLKTQDNKMLQWKKDYLVSHIYYKILIVDTTFDHDEDGQGYDEDFYDEDKF